MEYKDLKRIIELVKQNDIIEFELQDKDFKLSTKLAQAGQVVVQQAAAPAPQAAPAPDAPAEEPAKPKGPAISSPMVGTFYRASTPEAEPYVKVGDVVTPETTVCIIEAMKVMNEIKAETKGRILKVLTENGEAVEFGQDLFEIEAL